MSVVHFILTSIVISAGLFYIYQYLRKQRQNGLSKNTLLHIYRIDDGNQHTIIFAPDYNSNWFDELDKKYSWDNFDMYDNRLWQYIYQLIDPLPELAKGKTVSDIDFFNQLTRGQKVIYTFLLFNGETDNGGIYQFFFNRPEYYFAALETLKELKLDQLSQDYEKCVNELLGSVRSFVKQKKTFNNPKFKLEKRIQSFIDGYINIPSAEIIQEYYYKEAFKKQLYQIVIAYIDQHLDQFVKS